MDAKSRLLREALQEWATERKYGWSGGWNQTLREWHFELSGASFPLKVIVLENGSKAYVKGRPGAAGGFYGIVARTVRGLKAALTSLLKE